MRILVIAVLLLVCPMVKSQQLLETLTHYCQQCADERLSKTGLYILEKGQESLIARAWLAKQAEQSIDIQYFIWSTDNIGILAGEGLLSAAERGAKIRVLVDDLLVDAQDNTLIGLNAHPNVTIKIYNPKHSVGVSFFKKAWYLLTDFRASNQRMHDKVAIFDGLAGITGGRNMADEYFDYNQKYNFRDRDILVVGQAVAEMQRNFNEFWESDLAVAVDQLLDIEGHKLIGIDLVTQYQELHDYARNPENFEPEIRDVIEAAGRYMPNIISSLRWGDAVFISDVPGKNAADAGLGGGSEATSALVAALKGATQSVLIQTPYLVVPPGGLELFTELIERGVKVQISTNSLASTDNLMAYSGYHKQRHQLLKAGIEVYEYKPEPLIQRQLLGQYPRLQANKPIFAIHAKSMVIDNSRLYIGTFNLDPRSANLNTEVGVLVQDEVLAQQLAKSIQADMAAKNSWLITASFNPDAEVGLMKRMKLFFLKCLPLNPVL